jgi:uroporphyrin-III C-methyltransferase/precorrin-2 dehydrogenase/sirohydrochlorin ferrochelatase
VRERKYTVIVLMAYSFALEIQQSAMDKNIPLDIPAAFVSKIDSPEQTTVIGNLGALNEMAELCEKPAILIVGDAVAAAEAMPHLGKKILFTPKQ